MITFTKTHDFLASRSSTLKKSVDWGSLEYPLRMNVNGILWLLPQILQRQSFVLWI